MKITIKTCNPAGTYTSDDFWNNARKHEMIKQEFKDMRDKGIKSIMITKQMRK